MSLHKELQVTDDEKSYLANAQNWMRDEDDIADAFSQLSFHGQNYYSDLKPLFLFDFKNKAQLSLFNSIHVRDGALGLAAFFLENKTPQRGICKLLIAHHLSFLVPKEWKDNVYYYQINRIQKAPRGGDLILTGYMHPYCTPIETIKSLLPKLVAEHEGQTYFLPTLHQPKDEAESFNFHPHFVDVQNLLSQNFPHIKGLSWNDYQQLDHTRTKLVELDPNSYMWSDSYVTHFQCAQGGEAHVPSSTQSKILADIPLSPYHSLQIISPPPALHKAPSFYEELSIVEAEILNEKKLIAGMQDKSNLILGESAELSAFVHLYLKRYKT